MLFYALIRMTDPNSVLYRPSLLVQLSAQKESCFAAHLYSGRNNYRGRAAKIAFFLGIITFDTEATESSNFFSGVYCTSASNLKTSNLY
jgi:hypothetical protein